MSEQYKPNSGDRRPLDQGGEEFFARSLDTFETYFDDQGGKSCGFTTHGEVTVVTASGVITLEKDLTIKVETEKDTIAAKLAEHFYPDAEDEVALLQSTPTSSIKYALKRSNQSGQDKSEPWIVETYQLHDFDGESEATYRRDVHLYDRRSRRWQRDNEQSTLEPFTESGLQESARLLAEAKENLASSIPSQEKVAGLLRGLDLIPGGVR